MALLVTTYPEGYEFDTIYFTNMKGERVEAVPLETEEIKYLIKVSGSLEKQFDDFDLEQFENAEISDENFEDETLED